ncbi:MAG TPA: 3-phosphoshikimate 1-carboxyvinyltransferase [candidate division Zixibacteria bacterium]|nr:3-phosphoshikimate 1-carboxyvinyltransferase [candidate division Zixibacteria bacterium]
MNRIIKPVHKLGGTIEIPGDKSISHRALIFAAMARGRSRIRNLSGAADCLSTLSCLRSLGVGIEKISDGTIEIDGRGRFGFKEPPDILDAGNSGTTIRLMTGLLAGQPFYSVITGDKSLRKRPMKRIIDPLNSMGAEILALGNNNRPPIRIVGHKLKPISYTMPVASAQVKTALMIAGLLCDGTTTIIEKYQSRDHSERMFRYLGAEISGTFPRIEIKGERLLSSDIFVPGDISSTMFFVVAGLLVGDSEISLNNVGLNPTRTGCLTALKQMGADISVIPDKSRNEEPLGTIKVSSSRLKAIKIGAEDIPSMIDEIPILALAATQAEGKTIITGAEELRFKESDRLKTITIGLRRMGAAIVEKPDGLEIDGPTPLRGAEVDSFGDHRLAMTMAIAGLIAEGRTTISGFESVNISFPQFFDKLTRLIN